MLWNNHRKEIPKGVHAFLSPSTYSWYNYDDEKLIKTYINKLAAAKGTEYHALACKLIQMRERLPNIQRTFNLYVNDVIEYRLSPEVELYYSKYCYGTADAIGIIDNCLYVFDLKTGRTKVSFKQLLIYVALFFLEYKHYKPDKMNDIILRIYQSNDYTEYHPEIDEIIPMMEKIKHFSRVLETVEDKYNE